MKGERSIGDIEAHLLPAAGEMLDQLVWWGQASRAARLAQAARAAQAAMADAAA